MYVQFTCCVCGGIGAPVEWDDHSATINLEASWNTLKEIRNNPNKNEFFPRTKRESDHWTVKDHLPCNQYISLIF